MAISSCFVEDTDHGPHIVKSSHSLVGEREKKICILYAKTNYLMFSWNALCATNISKKKLSCSIKDNLFKAYVYIIMVTYMHCIQTH